MDIDELNRGMIQLIAQDLRAARIRLGITPTQAAKCARLDASAYKALEEGTSGRSREIAAEMVLAARSLGLESVRASYIDEVEQYMKIDLATEGPLKVFVDTLEADVPELEKQGFFVSPNKVLTLVERIGFDSTFDSRKAIDKKMSNCGSLPCSR